MRHWLLKIFLPLGWQMKEWVTALFCRNMPGSVETRFPYREISTVSLDLQVCNLPVEYKRNGGLTKTDVRNWFAHAIQAARAVLLMSVSMWKSTVTSTFNINLVAFFSNSASMPKPRITEIPLINLNIIFVKKKVISVREVHDTVLKSMLLRLIQLLKQIAPLTLSMT